VYGPPYKFGDIIGVEISLGMGEALFVRRDREGALLPEVESARELSYVKFYKNGEDLGIAYKDIRRGIYRAAISIYGRGSVDLNFGPYFAYPTDTYKEYFYSCL
jgi:hypothetical protein